MHIVRQALEVTVNGQSCCAAVFVGQTAGPNVLCSNLLSSSALFENMTTKLYRTVVVSFVLYGCKTWSLALKEELRLECWRIGCWGYSGASDRTMHDEERHGWYW